MKIYFSKLSSGRTTRMIKDFVKTKNSLFISDKIDLTHFVNKCKQLGIAIDELHKKNNLGFIQAKISNYNLSYYLSDSQYENIFFDLNNDFLDNISLGQLKEFENYYNMNFNIGYQKRIDVSNNEVEIIEF